jgi:hypothetical protein
VSFTSTPRKKQRGRKMAAAKNRRRKLAVEKPAGKRGPRERAAGKRTRRILRAAGEALPGRQIEFEEIHAKLGGALKAAQGICLCTPDWMRALLTM